MLEILHKTSARCFKIRFHLNFPDPDRFTWLLVILASFSFLAGILSLFVPKTTHKENPPKSEGREEKETVVEINQANEGDLSNNNNDNNCCKKNEKENLQVTMRLNIFR